MPLAVVAVVLIVFLLLRKRKRKKAKIKVGEFRVKSDPYGLFAQGKARNDLEKKYAAVLKKHAALEEKIGMKYSVAKELTLPDSPQMEQVIRLCKEDIALADQFLDYWREFYDIEQLDGDPTSVRFDSFKRLAIIYEKQEKYDEAIAVCKQAIKKGLIRDGTEGGMAGRAARLTKKKLSKAKKLSDSK